LKERQTGIFESFVITASDHGIDQNIAEQYAQRTDDKHLDVSPSHLSLRIKHHANSKPHQVRSQRHEKTFQSHLPSASNIQKRFISLLYNPQNIMLSSIEIIAEFFL
jgi:hypothetical protein